MYLMKVNSNEEPVEIFDVAPPANNRGGIVNCNRNLMVNDHYFYLQTDLNSLIRFDFKKVDKQNFSKTGRALNQEEVLALNKEEQIFFTIFKLRNTTCSQHHKTASQRSIREP